MNELENHAVLNTADALDRIGNKSSLYLKILEMFLINAPPILANIESALMDGDCAQLTSLGHKLKGLAASIGAEQLVARCAVIQCFDQSAVNEGLRQDVDYLKSEYYLAEDAVNRYLNHRT